MSKFSLVEFVLGFWMGVVSMLLFLLVVGDINAEMELDSGVQRSMCERLMSHATASDSLRYHRIYDCELEAK